MTGHLFIVPGDLLQLRCAAIALSADQGSIARRWLEPPTPPDLRSAVEPEARRHRSERCAYIGNWRGIALFRLDTGGKLDGTTPASWYVNGAVAFVRTAAAHLKATNPSGPPHRIALHFVGVGKGKADHLEMARELVPALICAARECAVDVVLVTSNKRSWFDVAQQARRRTPGAFDDLPQALETAAVALAGAFSEEQKPVVFVGAGVSIDAGLPGWARLLVDLSGLPAGGEQDALWALASSDALAAAEVVARLLGKGSPDAEVLLAARVKEKLAPDETATMPGLGHRLLAALPAEGYVTTNFDRLLENALGPEVAVMPHQPTTPGKRWVLKLHGTVGEDGLVLTRRSYLRYDARSRGLLSLVEASLLLRHLVVVGFSFTDQNFFRAVDSVRQVFGNVEANRPRRLFTGLVVGPQEPHRADLWPDASFVDFGKPEDGGGRLQLLFLDRLNALVSSQEHLLDERFADLLTDSEKKLVQALKGLRSALPAEGHDILRRALKHYGST
jgi:hypothetical protein